MGVFTGKAREAMDERFGQDSMVSLATVEDGIPSVRTVDGYYTGGVCGVVQKRAYRRDGYKYGTSADSADGWGTVRSRDTA